MAEAILGGVLSAHLASPDDVRVGEPRVERCRFLCHQYGVQASQDNLEATESTDLVVLAIKPQDLPTVFQQLHGRLRPEQAALSIVAGTKMSTLSQGLGHSAIIRVMPNTPAQIGQGMSLWTCSKEVDKAKRDVVQSILGTVGREIYVEDEKYLDMATALSASGPAYVFLFIEALIDAGVYVGLPRDMARVLALQTVYGSTKLVMDTGKHPAELKDMVVSPGGTTAEGLQALERAGVPAAVVDAVSAAHQKSIKLGQS
jgi:pyrroline-5-carboxylate reductase